MRFRLFCVLLGLVMGWTAQRASAALTKQGSADVRTGGRWIGVLQKGTDCPSVSGWSGSSLSDLVAQKQSPGRATLDALYKKYHLDRICFFEARAQSKKFQPPPGLKNAAPDRLAVVSAASGGLDPLGDKIWQPLASRFLDEAGGARFRPAQGQGARLVFIDTQPTHEGPPARVPAPNAWHGYGMAHLGDEIVCGHLITPESCPIRVATRLALRYESYRWEPGEEEDHGLEAGGHQGRIGDLALAILEEIEHWQAVAPRSRLILSLSVGWDGERLSTSAITHAEMMEASSLAVLDALRVASDLDVLVIAAAGNRSGGESSRQALLPAAWEMQLPGKKIVYAVGGVDWQGLPLANSRPAGLPQRVAYGDHAVVRTSPAASAGRAPESTKIYTGTSVSAVVVSSTAAVVWELWPKLTPAGVMKKLDSAARALPSPATFYARDGGSGPPHLHQVSLCRSLTSLCGADGRRCPALESIHCLSGRQPADLTKIVPGELPVPTRIDLLPACSKVSSTNACPMEKLPDMNDPSLIQTLPPETPCPTCSVAPDKPALATTAPSSSASSSGDGAYSLAVAFDPDWLARASDTAISGAVLAVRCSPGPPAGARLDLSGPFSALLASARSAASPPGRLKIDLNALGDALGRRRLLAGCTASLDFNLRLHGTEERSVQNAVYVDP